MPRGSREQRKAGLIEVIGDRLLGTGPLRMAATVCAWILLVGSIGVALGTGIPHLAVKKAADHDGSNAALLLLDAPDWYLATPELALQMQAAVGDQLRKAPTDRASLVHAHARLEQSGWFDEVRRLHRAANGDIHVEGTLAQPFAVVRWGSYDLLVDTKGRLLDWRFPSGEANVNLPVIIGARTPPPSNARGGLRYGAAWSEDEAIASGLDLLRFLEHSPWMEDVAEVDVSNHPESRCLWLTCDGGLRIRWGLAPGETSAAELTPAEKRDMVDSICRIYGPLHAFAAREIDIRHDLATISGMASAPTE